MYQKHESILWGWVATVAVMVTASSAFSQVPTMDGTVVGDEALYGAALSTQKHLHWLR